MGTEGADEVVGLDVPGNKAGKRGIVRVEGQEAQGQDDRSRQTGQTFGFPGSLQERRLRAHGSVEAYSARGPSGRCQALKFFTMMPRTRAINS